MNLTNLTLRKNILDLYGSYLKGQKKPHRLLAFPSHLQIQTTSYCQASCQMCPYPQVSRQTSMGRMPTKLFKKIINECQQFPVRHICLYLMNEPLLDGRLFSFANYIKQKLPQVLVEISTNALALSPQKARKLHRAKIDRIIFNNETMVTYPETRDKVIRFLKQEKKQRSYLYVMGNLYSRRKLKDMVAFWQKYPIIVSITQAQSRAGNIFHQKIKQYRQRQGKVCTKLDRPGRWLHILWNGEVILCCQDWRRKHIVGDVSQESLKKVFQGPKLNCLRRVIRGELSPPKDLICRKCQYWQ